MNYLLLLFARYACKDTTFFSNSTHYFEDIITVCAQKMFVFSRKPLYYVWEWSQIIIKLLIYNEEFIIDCVGPGNAGADGV